MGEAARSYDGDQPPPRRRRDDVELKRASDVFETHPLPQPETLRALLKPTRSRRRLYKKLDKQIRAQDS